jgi:nicotinamide mononucleotide transporter
MQESFNALVSSLRDTTFAEAVAVLFGIVYLLLIIFKQRIGWLFAAVSTAIYIVLDFQRALYIESFLQCFYFVMAFVGFYIWKTNNNQQIVIVAWSWLTHLKLISFGIVLSILVGFVFRSWTGQADPYLDSFTTVFSLLATYLTAKKVLSNWLYWVCIDSALVVLYFSNGLKLTSYHFAFYALMAVFGYFKWLSQYRLQEVQKQ